MDLRAPLRTVTPTLDGPVLAALAGADAPLTRAQITRLVGDASEAGVRKVLARLNGQGVVLEDRIAGRFIYSANRDHLAWLGIEHVLSAPAELDHRISCLADAWQVQPLSIELFGSVAQGTSTSESDIDVLVISPELQDPERETWEQQIDVLRDRIEVWTGNRCDVLVLNLVNLLRAAAENDLPLRSTRVSVVGTKIEDMISATGRAGHGDTT